MGKKPEDWVDEEMMDDPGDKKPDGYDDIPAKIADPKATKPDDWDDESDGEWEAPQIDNPEYKGVWKAKRIDNPKYAPDDKLYSYPKFSTVGIDVWQVKSGTIFDNMLITDDVAYATEHAEKTWEAAKDGEKAAEEKRKKEEEERKKKEEEDKKKKEEEDAKKAEEGGDENKEAAEKKEL